MRADGYSLDDKRQKVGENDIPDIIKKWKVRDKNKEPIKGEKWLWVNYEEIKKNDFDLSISRYKPIEYEEVEYEKPEIIIDNIHKIETEIVNSIKNIKKSIKNA